MSAQGDFANVQAALRTKPDGIPGALTDAAYLDLKTRALAEYHAGKETGDTGNVAGFDGILDLNHSNGFDVAKMKAGGIGAVIHKATEGITFADSKYATRKAEALAAGLLWGAYHFSSGDDGVAQALHFLAVENGRDPKTLLALDMEPSSHGPDMTVAQAEAFVSTIHLKTGRWPVIYGGGGLLRDLMEDKISATLSNCPLWLADYRAHPKAIPPTWPKWTLLQFSDGEQGQEPKATPGSDGADRNAFAGTEEQLRSAWPLA